MYARRRRRVQSADTNNLNSSISKSRRNPELRIYSLIISIINGRMIPARHNKTRVFVSQTETMTCMYMHACMTSINQPGQGGGAATRLTADQLYPGSNPGLGSQ